MQAAKEKALGIEVAAFMQNLTNPLLRRQNQGQCSVLENGRKRCARVPAEQLTNPPYSLFFLPLLVNFIDVVLIPWWRAVSRIFPGYKACYKNLIVNRAYYNSSEQSAAPSPHSLSSTVNSVSAPAAAAAVAAHNVATQSASASAHSSAVPSPLPSPSELNQHPTLVQQQSQLKAYGSSDDEDDDEAHEDEEHEQ